MINKDFLRTATLTATVADDLTSTWEVTDAASKKWIVILPAYNPETREEFTSKENAEEVMVGRLQNNPNYWEPYHTPEEQKVIDTPFEKGRVRRERDELLDKYEWTVNSPDLTDDKKAEWKTYRQALRDLPDQSGFPWEADGMAWPTKPTS